MDTRATLDRLPFDADRAAALLRDWERQQEVYVQAREARFATVVDALDLLPAGRLRILDIACGPGSLGDRVKARRPDAEVVGLDYDPVLLALAAAARAGQPGRHWRDADLAGPDWHAGLEPAGFDAVISATALHWLPPATVAAIYARARTLLRPGGILVNADLMAYGADQPRLAALAHSYSQTLRRTLTAAGTQDWAAWWRQIDAEPDLAQLVAERNRRFPAPQKYRMPVPSHLDWLRAAGFVEVGTLWQHLDHAVVIGMA